VGASGPVKICTYGGSLVGTGTLFCRARFNRVLIGP